MGDDIRDVANYGISQAARYVRVSRGTLAYWMHGPAPRIRTPERGAMLSFNNLVEAHVLRTLRNVLGTTPGLVEAVLSSAGEALRTSRPLLHEELFSGRGELFVEFIALSKSGQLALLRRLEDCSARVDRDDQGHPFRLYPVLARESSDPRAISIDPTISFGNPTLAGAGISTKAVVARVDAGEEIAALAHDYGLTEDQIQDAILYEAAVWPPTRVADTFRLAAASRGGGESGAEGVSDAFDRVLPHLDRPPVTTAVGSTVHDILKLDDAPLDTATRDLLYDAAYRLASDDVPGALDRLEAAREDDRDVGGGQAVAAIEEIMTEIAEGRATH